MDNVMALKRVEGNKPKMKRKAYEQELRKLQVRALPSAGLGQGQGSAHHRRGPMDIESYRRWYDYSRARDMMLDATDSKHAPWHIVRSDDKRRVRLNCIAHILRLVPYKKVPHTKVKLPKRSGKGRYDDRSTLKGRNFVRETY
jgi:hypothetical protein